MNGTFAEASGVATMTTATGNSTVFGGTNFIQHNAILLTNTQPLTTSTNGLKSDDTFSASGLFNVSIPTANRESYGVYFTDRLGVGGSVNTGDDQLEMRMVRDAMGDLRIQFQRVDWTTQTSTGIQSILLSTAVGTAFNDTTNDQLLLRLDNNLNIDGTSFVTASYEYFDNGSSLSNGLLSFSNTASIFNGEDYTRAAFFARVAQPVAAVPEPEIYAMMGLGLGLIGWIGRRKKLKEAAAA